MSDVKRLFCVSVCYLINYEYFNNLNEDKDMARTRDGNGAGRGRVLQSHTHPHKKKSSPNPNPMGTKFLSHHHPHWVYTRTHTQRWQINPPLWVLPEPVPVLTGNPRFDQVWVWVWGIPNFFNWVWGWGCTYPRHNTRPYHISILV